MSDALTEANRAIVLDFVDLFYRQRRVREAFERHVAEDYTQHNPTIPDGREPAIAMLAPKFANPQAVFDVKRVLVDGNLACVHLHGAPSPGTLGAAVADLFRLADGKIVEHWDVLQAVPEKSINPHPMF